MIKLKNKILIGIIIILLPFAVISFNKNKTNFNLLKNKTVEEKKDLTIRLKTNSEEVVELDLEDYVIGVVAGEMPASFEQEALKAQAVASRTYAMYKKGQDNDYDVLVTTSDQVYLNEEQMKEKWPEGYDKYYNKIKEAVIATKGQVLNYNNEIIPAYYFSMSNGYTENSQAVFNEQKDYLVSVESNIEEPVFKTIRFSKEEFCSKLNISCDTIHIGDIKYTSSKRVESIIINDKKFSGVEIRKLLDLRSTDFTIEPNEEEIQITTNGYGHGVGMSQYGANAMAKNGSSYQDILKHYYQNTEINNL